MSVRESSGAFLKSGPGLCCFGFSICVPTLHTAWGFLLGFCAVSVMVLNVLKKFGPGLCCYFVLDFRSVCRPFIRHWDFC